MHFKQSAGAVYSNIVKKLTVSAIKSNTYLFRNSSELIEGPFKYLELNKIALDSNLVIQECIFC